MNHEGKIHREKFQVGRNLTGEVHWGGKGETLHIQKCETVFVLMKGRVVYEKERKFHNSFLSRNFSEINLSSF